MDMRYSHDGCFCGDPFCAGCDQGEFSDVEFDRDFRAGEEADPAGDELCEYYGFELLTDEQLAVIAEA